MSRIAGAALVCALLFSVPLSAQQAPERPLLSVGPAGSALTSGESGDSGWPDLYGFGVGATVTPGSASSRTGPLDYVTVGAFYYHYPAQGEDRFSAAHYGAELAMYVLPRPALGLLDPYLAFGYGLLAIEPETEDRDPWAAISPGVGLRMVAASGFELRADGRFLPGREVDGTSRPTYFELSAGLRLGF